MTRWLAAAQQAQSAGTKLTKPTKAHLVEVVSVVSVLSGESEANSVPTTSCADNARQVSKCPTNVNIPLGDPALVNSKTWTGRVIRLDQWKRIKSLECS